MTFAVVYAGAVFSWDPHVMPQYGAAALVAAAVAVAVAEADAAAGASAPPRPAR